MIWFTHPYAERDLSLTHKKLMVGSISVRESDKVGTKDTRTCFSFPFSIRLTSIGPTLPLWAPFCSASPHYCWPQLLFSDVIPGLSFVFGRHWHLLNHLVVAVLLAGARPRTKPPCGVGGSDVPRVAVDAPGGGKTDNFWGWRGSWADINRRTLPS